MLFSHSVGMFCWSSAAVLDMMRRCHRRYPSWFRTAKVTRLGASGSCSLYAIVRCGKQYPFFTDIVANWWMVHVINWVWVFARFWESLSLRTRSKFKTSSWIIWIIAEYFKSELEMSFRTLKRCTSPLFHLPSGIGKIRKVVGRRQLIVNFKLVSELKWDSLCLLKMLPWTLSPGTWHPGLQPEVVTCSKQDGTNYTKQCTWHGSSGR